MNLEALSSWFGHIPNSTLERIDELAPLLAHVGYDTKSFQPSYGEPDANVKENTWQIKAKQEMWKKLAKSYSDRV